MRKIAFHLRVSLVLVLIILSGLALRVYNINFPSIGYHNMKENEYLSQAQEMLRTNDYINRRVYFYNAFENSQSLRTSFEFPVVAYQTIILWKIFGENLWSARLCNILFGLLSILMMYLIGRELLSDIYSPLLASLLLAIMPIAVFFSRNIQSESPALFFMLLGSFLYLRRNLFLGGLSFVASWIYQPNFIIGAVPFIFFIRLRGATKTRMDLLRLAFAGIAPYLFILSLFLWLRYMPGHGMRVFTGSGLLNIFTAGYWKKYGVTVWRYIALEDFTLVFTLAAFVGILFALFKRKTPVERYIMGWVLAIILYGMLYGDAMHQASFYYTPFLALACVSSAYCISQISEAVKKIFKKDIAIGLIIMLISISLPFIYSSLKGMYATVFLGLDVAGESIKEFTKPDERVFLFTHAQGNAIARYARRYVGWPADIDDFKEKEKRFNVNYLCVYPIEFMHTLEAGNPALYGYIQDHYHVKEAGFTQDPYQPVYLILEKGHGTDLKEILKNLSGSMQRKSVYKLFDRYIFFYTLRPKAE